MVTYEVTAIVPPHCVADFESYMPGHIADVLATGFFENATLEEAAPGRYRARYVALDQASLDRYLAEHSPRLRKDFAAHFPNGVELSREVWTEVHRESRRRR